MSTKAFTIKEGKKCRKNTAKNYLYTTLWVVIFRMNQITLAFDNLAQQAISNNYSFYQEGKQ